MAVGDTEKEFARLAASEGVTLSRAVIPGINRRGHFGLPVEAEAASGPLDVIFSALGGNPVEQRAKTRTPLRGDFLHESSGTIVEIDESQHFTSHRLRALDLYPTGAPLNFDLDKYRALCATWAPRADNYFASKAARGFGPGGRQRQRAYNDSLRDLAAPLLGYRVIRVPAPERDPHLAYARVRQQLAALAAPTEPTEPQASPN